MTLQSYYKPTEFFFKGVERSAYMCDLWFSTTVLLALIYAPFFPPKRRTTSDPWDEDRVSSSPAKPLEERNR